MSHAGSITPAGRAHSPEWGDTAGIPAQSSSPGVSSELDSVVDGDESPVSEVREGPGVGDSLVVAVDVDVGPSSDVSDPVGSGD